MNNHRALKMPESLISAHTAIVEACCKAFEVSPDELLSGERTARIVRARHAAMWLMRRCTTLSLTDIGSLFERDHTTVLNAARKMEDLFEDPQSNAGGQLRSLYSQFTAQKSCPT